MLRIPRWKRNAKLIFSGLLALAVLAVLLPVRPKTAHADEEVRFLSVTKDCKDYTGAAGSFCTIQSSNIPEIVQNAMVFYDQPLWATISPATAEASHIGLDSNVVLWAGTGDWAVGRCTLDPTFHGICVFSGGTGQFTGFHAHVNVAPAGGTLYSWEGTYSFRP